MPNAPRRRQANVASDQFQLRRQEAQPSSTKKPTCQLHASAVVTDHATLCRTILAVVLFAALRRKILTEEK
ncbi:hypothetical protein M0R45_001382 [Rubus argutus]|uniref:Uncharacterized protein n=1 Tax=Rubus argutus TaxID=59490 RepID=A0AAW1VHQ9_RUBAR